MLGLGTVYLSRLFFVLRNLTSTGLSAIRGGPSGAGFGTLVLALRVLLLTLRLDFGAMSHSSIGDNTAFFRAVNMAKMHPVHNHV